MRKDVITAIVRKEKIAEIKKARSKIFNEFDVCQPFQPDISERGLLFPVDFMLTESYFSALSLAALSVGDEVCILSVLEKIISDEKKEVTDWIIPLRNRAYLNFHSQHRASKNMLFSPRSKWGIYFLPDSHAVIGGSARFWKTFFENIEPTQDEQVRDYLDMCKYNRDEYGYEYWGISKFLSHILGKEVAKKYLDSAGFS